MYKSINKYVIDIRLKYLLFITHEDNCDLFLYFIVGTCHENVNNRILKESSEYIFKWNSGEMQPER